MTYREPSTLASGTGPVRSSLTWRRENSENRHPGSQYSQRQTDVLIMARSVAKLITVALLIAGITACADAAADSAKETMQSYKANVDAQIAAVR